MKKLVYVLGCINMMLCGAMLGFGVSTLIEAIREGNAWYYLSGIGDILVTGLGVWNNQVIRGMIEKDRK